MNVIIFHGTGETKDSFWIPWLSGQLAEKRVPVSIPQMPHPENPVLEECLPVVLKEKFNSETIVIGHSSGCALIMSFLEQINICISKAILVGGYVRPLTADEYPILQKKYDWDKIRNHAKDFVFINSDDDPWGCTDIEGRYMLDAVGKGVLVIPKGQGHMGSVTFNQPYREFPLLLSLVAS